MVCTLLDLSTRQHIDFFSLFFLARKNHLLEKPSWKRQEINEEKPARGFH